ncbi:hypothetical protein GW17_00002521 [Ensete ventricosum]|nr:hypothetical protein GW17_00002521 [Ensete ventricosum]
MIHLHITKKTDGGIGHDWEHDRGDHSRPMMVVPWGPGGSGRDRKRVDIKTHAKIKAMPVGLMDPRPTLFGQRTAATTSNINKCLVMEPLNYTCEIAVRKGLHGLLQTQSEDRNSCPLLLLLVDMTAAFKLSPLLNSNPTTLQRQFLNLPTNHFFYALKILHILIHQRNLLLAAIGQMGGHSCCHKQKPRKGLWSPEEDEKLIKHINKYGHGCWSTVPNQAAHLPGRTDNEIKNLWNSSIKKKLIQRGIDPSSHKPLAKVDSGDDDKAASNSEKNSGSSDLQSAIDKSMDESSTLKKEIFLDQFLTSSSSCCSSNSMGYLPFPQVSFPDYSSSSQVTSIMINSNPLLWLNCNAISAPITTLSTSMALPPSYEEENDDTIPSWYTGNRKSVNDGGHIMLQSSCSFDSGIFSCSELTSEKDVQTHLRGETEDLKWSEYLQGAFQCQPMYGDIKTGNQSPMNIVSALYQNQQPRQELQASDIHGKRFHSVSLGFEHL